ncbi:MAG: hypothetical protein G8345_18700 [Magnetococcales bacterium]|nr:hypothetical protein [Magnetococcales bacterium]
MELKSGVSALKHFHLIMSRGINMQNAFLYILVAILLNGCATITQGSKQMITFSIEPKISVCELTRIDDGILGSVNGNNNVITVSKDKDDIVIKCSSPGYKTSTSRLVSSATGSGVTGAIFLDLGIVDMTTGAMWAYPSEVTITLEKE